MQRAQRSRGCNSWRRRRRTHPPRPCGWRAGWMQSKPLALFPSHLVLSLRCPSPSKPTRLTSGTHERTRPESPRQLRAQQHWHLPVRPAQGYRSRNLLFGHCGARRRRNIGSVGRWLQRRPNARRHSRRRGCNPRVGKSSTTSPRPTCRKTSSSAGTSRRMPTASLRSSCSTAFRSPAWSNQPPLTLSRWLRWRASVCLFKSPHLDLVRHRLSSRERGRARLGLPRFLARYPLRSDSAAEHHFCFSIQAHADLRPHPGTTRDALGLLVDPGSRRPRWSRTQAPDAKPHRSLRRRPRPRAFLVPCFLLCCANGTAIAGLALRCLTKERL